MTIGKVLLKVVLCCCFRIPPCTLILGIVLVPLFPFIVLANVNKLLFSRLSKAMKGVKFEDYSHLLSFCSGLYRLASTLPNDEVIAKRPGL